MSVKQFNAVGKRKSAIARAYLSPGSGNFTINNRDFTTYFSQSHLQTVLEEPFATTNTVGQFDVKLTIRGGGKTGQLHAARHAIARALLEAAPETSLSLKKANLLTRDARRKERNIYGQKGARARFQFSKR